MLRNALHDGLDERSHEAVENTGPENEGDRFGTLREGEEANSENSDNYAEYQQNLSQVAVV